MTGESATTALCQYCYLKLKHVTVIQPSISVVYLAAIKTNWYIWTVCSAFVKHARPYFKPFPW